MPPNATKSDDSDAPDDNANQVTSPTLSAAYGLVDGFNTSSSTLRLIFDISYNNTQLSIQALHEWMLTKTGIVVCLIETVLITGLSLVSNLVPKFKLNKDIWKIVRNTYKAFKNAYKGLRGLLQTVNAATQFNFFPLIIPAWLTMGFFSAVNRIGYQELDEERKKIIKKNDDLRQRVNHHNADECPFSDYHKDISKQSFRSTVLGYLSKAYGGFIDGLYLYMGMAVIVVLTPSMFTMVAWFSVGFVLTCIATRLYEEHLENRHVSTSEDQVKLSISYQDIKKLLKTEEKPAPSALELKMQGFLACRDRVLHGFKLSSTEAILDGLKNGLAIYGATSALLFSAYTLTLILSYTFPAVFIPICATFGMICLVGCSIYSYLQHSPDTADQATLDESLLRLCRTNDIERIRSTIDTTMNFETLNSSVIPKHSEVLRSGFSGIGKAPKAIEFALGALQEQDDNGRYYDTPFMFLLMLPCTAFYIWTLGLSSYRDEFQKQKKTVEFFTVSV